MACPRRRVAPGVDHARSEPSVVVTRPGSNQSRGTLTGSGAPDADRAPVCLDDGSRDRQPPDRGPLSRAAAGLVRSVEALEEVGQVRGVDVGAVVGGRDSHRLPAFQVRPERGEEGATRADGSSHWDASQQCLWDKAVRTDVVRASGSARAPGGREPRDAAGPEEHRAREMERL